MFVEYDMLGRQYSISALMKLGTIKGQGAIRAFFGINMSKNENPSKQNDILVVVKVTLIYFTTFLLI
jgi:hypothetical protein